jgi:DNA modification methylase
LRAYIARKRYYPYASIIIHNVINTNANAAHPQPYYHRVMTAPKTKRLYYGDNLHVLREHIKDESVDLIYLDPPFNSKRDYNLLFKTPKGMESDAQITAFEDSWHWGQQAEDEFKEILKSGNTDVAELMQALRAFLKENDMMAYLTMMANRLLELHRVLKDTGSLYLHCDPTASHYLKLVLDGVFGQGSYRTEISWKRSSAHNDAKQGRMQYGNIRDTIFFYSKNSKEWNWNWLYTDYDDSYVRDFYKYVDKTSGRRYRMGDLTAAKEGGDTRYEWRVKRAAGSEWEADFASEWKAPIEGYEYKGILPYGKRIWAYSKDNLIKMASDGRIVYSGTGVPNYKRYLDEMPGVPLQNIWDDIRPASGEEYLGYPTQKPVALLERIISASSNEGDVVLDPFCGCGTAVHAAEKLKRQWIGIDITHLSVSLIEKRMKKAFAALRDKGAFEIIGTPQDFDAAKDLSERDKYQFQFWACTLVGAQPYKGGKKGADGGIDGLIFPEVGKSKTEKIIVSVKGGANVGRAMIAQLKGDVEREKAAIGLFITLTQPTKEMVKEAAAAGHYESPHHGDFPKIQILTIEGLLNGTERAQFPDMSFGDQTFKAAKAEKKNKKSDQTGLFE